MKPLLLFLSFVMSNFLYSQDIALYQNAQAEADSLFSYVKRAMLRVKRDTIATLLDRGISLSAQLKNDTLLCKFYLEKSSFISLGGDKKDALRYLYYANHYFDKTASYLTQDKYYSLAGYIHSVLLNYDSSLHYAALAEKNNNSHNPYRNWFTYYQMALTYSQAELYEEAEKYYWKSYHMVKAKRIATDYGLLLCEFCSFLSKRDMKEKYATLLAEYNNYLSGPGSKLRSDPIHSMMFYNWNDISFQKKVDFMKSVKKILLDKGDTSNAAYANNIIVKFYEDDKQLDESLKYVQENLTTLKPENHPYYEYINSNIAYRILKKMNKTEEALAMAEKMMKLKDSISSTQLQTIAKEFDARYESQKKEKEIELLNYQNDLGKSQLLREQEIKKRLQLEAALKDSLVAFEQSNNNLLASDNASKDARIKKEEELKNSLNRENELISKQNLSREKELVQEKKIKGLLIAAAALLMVCAAVILQLYRKQKIKNRLIQKQADELEVLMKEIHHRVKNNMQIVSSLLDLQGNTIKDNQAAEAVKEGKNRVQSMAIIHQHLYQEGNIRGIRMDDYIHTLTQNLFASYNINPSKIKLQTDIQQLNLDVDTVIPIGLIINELVSNSLKYAFDKSDTGLLSISLKEKNNSLELLIKDDGKGFPAGLNIHKNNSFGLQLIDAFAQKLKAKLDFYNDNGAAVSMQIKKFKLAG